MSHRMRLLIGLFLICLLPALCHAAEVQATLDRTQVQLGETVTLNLQLRGATGMNAPDLSALRNDFDVLGTSSSSSINIVNGRQSVQVTYGVVLRPRHVGRLQIPALQVAGSTTRPLTVDVTAAAADPSSSGGKDVFLQASVDPSQAYVGQQVTLTVRIYYAANLTSASLTDPQVHDADVSRLGDDSSFQAQRYGRTYNVIARRYELVPQHAGTLRIPPVQFRGAMMFQGNPFDPNDPGNFFGGGREMSAASPAVSIQIRPVPASWGSAAWLPARALSLSLDGVPGPTETVRVGQPFTVTMNVQATGIPFDALPALSLPAMDGATAYPEQPVTGNRHSGSWVVGRRQHAYAVVPNRPGTLVIPATMLKWWNVLADQPEVATIPAHTLHVLLASGAAGSAPASSAPAASAGSAQAPAASASITAPVHAVPAAEGTQRGATLRWRWIALGAVVLALLLLGAGWLWRRRGAPQRPASAPANDSRRLRQAFMLQVREGDAPAQAHALLAWARSERPGLPHLGALAAALELPAQRQAITQLQQRIYAPAGAVHTHADGSLQRAFENGLVWLRPPDAGDSGTLPPLYPFKLHD